MKTVCEKYAPVRTDWMGGQIEYIPDTLYIPATLSFEVVCSDKEKVENYINDYLEKCTFPKEILIKENWVKLKGLTLDFEKVIVIRGASCTSSVDWLQGEIIELEKEISELKGQLKNKP